MKIFLREFYGQSIVFSLTVTKISLSNGTDAPRKSPFGANNYRHHPHSQSCPSLLLPSLHDATEISAGVLSQHGIAIHVSVTTTRSADEESLSTASCEQEAGIDSETTMKRGGELTVVQSHRCEE